MKKTAVVWILWLITLVFATSFVAFAAPPGPPGPPPHGPGFFGGPPGLPPGPPPPGGGFLGLLGGPPDLIEKLKLTDDQVKQARSLAVDFQNKTRKPRTALMGLHDEKRTMFISGKIDQAKLTKLDEEITQLSAEVMGEDLKMQRDQLSKLTPEQVSLLAAFSGKGEVVHEPKMMGK